jgi:hypothetical protein
MREGRERERARDGGGGWVRRSRASSDCSIFDTRVGERVGERIGERVGERVGANISAPA